MKVINIFSYDIKSSKIILRYGSSSLIFTLPQDIPALNEFAEKIKDKMNYSDIVIYFFWKSKEWCIDTYTAAKLLQDIIAICNQT